MLQLSGTHPSHCRSQHLLVLLDTAQEAAAPANASVPTGGVSASSSLLLACKQVHALGTLVSSFLFLHSQQPDIPLLYFKNQHITCS